MQQTRFSADHCVLRSKSIKNQKVFWSENSVDSLMHHLFKDWKLTLEYWFDEFMYKLKRDLSVDGFKRKIDEIKEKKDELVNNVRCIKTRLMVYAKMKKYGKYYRRRPKRVAKIINSMDDCVEGKIRIFSAINYKNLFDFLQA